ncbi:hypothetical protein [Microbacterium sp. BK668]|uniref:hypothetical protein n=1 Tax=Microbacterium sp. BK668 TaxID=2512118 RepID=UPI0010E48F0A|nr:hypothetical protein [Microbacterium sp. BK668]TDN91625.1 hypothetical protein EV279_1128 [Microbacterium sp. BK668]
MTSTLERPHGTLLTSSPRPIRWHRPLLGLAAVMAALTAFALVARFVSPVEITGLNQWDKPLKFSISILIYAVTWSWLIGQLQRARRLAWIGGTVIAITLAVEMAVIVWAAATGQTSHFNVSTPLNTAMWTVMAVSITVLWLATFVVAILLFFSRLGDRARTVAIRTGAVISLAGLGLGYLMTGPTAQQLDDFQGIAGAHTVGLADGGPGLPILGWSTVAGDLRIPHFVGMHALQVIPLVLIGLELLSRRVPVLRDVRVRTRLVWTTAAGYSGLIGIVTWQALRGQSIVAPDATTLAAFGALLFGVAAVATQIVLSALQDASDAASDGAAEQPRGRARRCGRVAAGDSAQG